MMSSSQAALPDWHLEALRWFENNAGRVFLSRPRYVTGISVAVTGTQTGIWKPHDTQYALSVIQTHSHPYPDLPPYYVDGTWVYQYHQQGDPARGINSHYTNIALDKCRLAGIPVGVIVPTQDDSSSYTVLGLAFVDAFRDGYFILSGPAHLDDAGFLLGAAQENLEFITFAAEEPSAYSAEDLRQRAIASVVRRQGQPHFRRALLVAYDGKCAMSEFDAEESLEAAHIRPYSGPRSNHVQNGLLLRADMHDLFDLGLVAVDTAHETLLLSKELASTQYARYAGRRLHLPGERALWPSADLLDEHRQLARL